MAATATLAQETVNKLLDFNQKLDIGLLDQVVGTMYSGVGDQQKMAQEVLTTLKEHPEAWTKVRVRPTDYMWRVQYLIPRLLSLFSSLLLVRAPPPLLVLYVRYMLIRSKSYLSMPNYARNSTASSNLVLISYVFVFYVAQHFFGV